MTKPQDTHCRVCGTELPVPHDPRQFLCSYKCKEPWAKLRRQQAKSEARTGAKCERCSKNISDKRSDARFCSDECSQAQRNTSVSEQLRQNRKPCLNCGQPIPLQKQRFCSDKCALAYRRPKAYGLTPAELAELLRQNNVCAICKTAGWTRKGPQVDHDHETGRVRGILCSNCNQGLGRFKDDPSLLLSAVEYLRTT